MILLDTLSKYENSYEFLLFDDAYELNFSDAVAKISVYIINSIDEQIKPIILIVVDKIKEFDISDSQIIRLFSQEVVLENNLDCYTIRIIKELK